MVWSRRDDEARHVGLLRGGAQDRHAPKNSHNSIDGSPRPRPLARFPFPSFCCSSRLFASLRVLRELRAHQLALRPLRGSRRPRSSREVREDREEQQYHERCPHVFRSRRTPGSRSKVYHLTGRACDEMLQIPSVALFEQVPLHQLLTPQPSHSDSDLEPIPIFLLLKTLGHY